MGTNIENQDDLDKGYKELTKHVIGEMRKYLRLLDTPMKIRKKCPTGMNNWELWFDYSDSEKELKAFKDSAYVSNTYINEGIFDNKIDHCKQFLDWRKLNMLV